MPVKRTLFQSKWKNDPKFKSWLAEDPESKLYFVCKKCQVTRELGNMGKTALTRHMNSQKHIGLDQTRKSRSAGLMASWARSNQPALEGIGDENSDESNVVDNHGSQTVEVSQTDENDNYQDARNSETSINKWMTGEEVSRAEALYSLHTTVHHIANRACNNSSGLFEAMFPDSKIAKEFSCAKDKNSWIVSFGLAPYFLDQLFQTLSEVPMYSVSFDEAYNRVTKNEQLDLAVRYWDKKTSRPVTRYIGSEFLGHSTAENLLRSFNKATAQLEQEKIINLGMDGPSTNHKFLRLFQEQRSQQSEYNRVSINCSEFGISTVCAETP